MGHICKFLFKQALSFESNINLPKNTRKIFHEKKNQKCYSKPAGDISQIGKVSHNEFYIKKQHD